MIFTVLVIWFAAVAIAGIVIGSYDNESARSLIIGIVSGAVLFLSLVKGKHFDFDFDLEVENTNLIDWEGKKGQYEKRFAKKA